MLMKHILRITITFVVNVFVITLAVAAPLPAPKNWQETQTGNSRILTKGTSRLEIGPWQSLGGQSLERYLKSIEHIVPDHTTFVSSKGVKPEGNDGAFYITRAIKLDGKDGNSILFGCPGQPGYARIMEMSVANTNLRDLFSGSLFVDKVCKEESKGGELEAIGTVRNPASIDQIKPGVEAITAATNSPSSSGDLAKENAKIPADNRPGSAVTITKVVLKGFNPVIPVPVGRMVMKFPNGYSTMCTNWDVVNQKPTPQSIGSEECMVAKTIPESWGTSPTPLQPFAKGETVDLAVGSISGQSFNFGSAGTFGNLSQNDLIMTKDGRIAFGSKVFSETAAGFRNSSSQRTGRYYLDGYTLTIETDDGDIAHTYIGILSRTAGKVTSLFLTNQFYSASKK